MQKIEGSGTQNYAHRQFPKNGRQSEAGAKRGSNFAGGKQDGKQQSELKSWLHGISSGRARPPACDARKSYVRATTPLARDFCIHRVQFLRASSCESTQLDVVRDQPGPCSPPACLPDACALRLCRTRATASIARPVSVAR